MGTNLASDLFINTTSHQFDVVRTFEAILSNPVTNKNRQNG